MCLCASVSAGAQSPAKAALPLSIYLSDRGGEIAISAEIATPSISPTEAVRRVLGCCRSSQPCWRAWSSRSQSLTPMKEETQLAKRKYRAWVLEVAKLDARAAPNRARLALGRYGEIWGDCARLALG